MILNSPRQRKPNYTQTENWGVGLSCMRHKLGSHRQWMSSAILCVLQKDSFLSESCCKLQNPPWPGSCLTHPTKWDSVYTIELKKELISEPEAELCLPLVTNIPRDHLNLQAVENFKIQLSPCSLHVTLPCLNYRDTTQPPTLTKQRPASLAHCCFC